MQSVRCLHIVFVKHTETCETYRHFLFLGSIFIKEGFSMGRIFRGEESSQGEFSWENFTLGEANPDII